MSGHEKFSAFTTFYHVHTRAFRFRKQLQLGHIQYIFFSHFRMATMRNVKYIIETTKYRMKRIESQMLVNAKLLFLERVLRNSIMMVQPGLCRPTNIKSGGNVRACPVEYFGDFVPVTNFFIIHQFHRSTGYNHTIELLMTHFIKIIIKSLHVLYGCILRGVAFYFHE